MFNGGSSNIPSLSLPSDGSCDFYSLSFRVSWVCLLVCLCPFSVFGVLASHWFCEPTYPSKRVHLFCFSQLELISVTTSRNYDSAWITKGFIVFSDLPVQLVFCFFSLGSSPPISNYIKPYFEGRVLNFWISNFSWVIKKSFMVAISPSCNWCTFLILSFLKKFKFISLCPLASEQFLFW